MDEFSRILQQNEFNVEYAEPGKRSQAEYLASLLSCPADQGIVFSSDFWYCHLASLYPEAMVRVLRQNRCLIFRMKYTFGSERGRVCADLVTFDYAAMARKIAEDFARGRAATKDSPVVFEAEYHAGISAHRMGALVRGL